MTGHADEQGTRMAGLPDINQRLVTSFHSAPDYIKTAICTLLEIEMAYGEAQAQVSPESKHKHASRREEESTVEEARTSEMPSRAEPISFRTITNPELPSHGIVPVNSGPPDGSSDTHDAGYSIRINPDGEIKGEEEHAAAADRSVEKSEAEEEAEDPRSARSAHGLFLWTSAAGDEVARAHTGLFMLDNDEEDDEWKGDETSTPTLPSRGLFSMMDTEAMETPQYFLDFEEDDEEEDH